jgi:hypothetical protein
VKQAEHKKRAEELLDGYVELLEEYRSSVHSMTPVPQAAFGLSLLAETRELAAVHALLAQVPDKETYPQ